MHDLKLKIILSIVISFFTSATLRSQQLLKSYYDFKKTKIHEEYYGTAAGVKNGAYKEFSETGSIITTGAYKNDVKIGQWQYKVNGSTEIETYDNNGDRNGKWLKYCPMNPKFKTTEGSYKVNEKDGIWTEYFCEFKSTSEVAKIEKQETYSNGKINGKCVYVQKNGDKAEGLIVNNSKVGEWKSTDKNGRLYLSKTYGKRLEPYDLIERVSYFVNGMYRQLKTLIDCSIRVSFEVPSRFELE
ncbi:MAG: hypothetical protein H0W61_10955 [Bacteroidetes bacterium]|nr:hypothetical protein [Bacteroidota bacterium]